MLCTPMLQGDDNDVRESRLGDFDFQFLVWLWMEKRRPRGISGGVRIRRGWCDGRIGGAIRCCWPVILLGICAYFRSNVTWAACRCRMGISGFAGNIDAPGGRAWGGGVFLLLRFLAADSLPGAISATAVSSADVCALVAATMAWMNPASILDSFGWLAVGCVASAIFPAVGGVPHAAELVGGGGIHAGAWVHVFKGQLLFVSPVIILAPLIAGWPGTVHAIGRGDGREGGNDRLAVVGDEPAGDEMDIPCDHHRGVFLPAFDVGGDFWCARARGCGNRFHRDWPGILQQTTLAAAARFCSP